MKIAGCHLIPGTGDPDVWLCQAFIGMPHGSEHRPVGGPGEPFSDFPTPNLHFLRIFFITSHFFDLSCLYKIAASCF
jgi:hypothetical protein